MFPRLRFAVLSIALGLGQLLCESTGMAPGGAAGLARASAQDGADGADGKRGTKDEVFRYRGANGREVFTNAGHVSIAGTPVEAMALPELGSVDLASASELQLQQLDRSVQLAHEELQAGKRCQAIRASLRVPVRALVWGEHMRHVIVGGALLLLAFVLMVAWNGRLKRLMPLAPLLGCVYLGYVTYERITDRLGALRDGLQACTSDLPPAQASDPVAVKGRLASAFELQSKVDRAYAQRASLTESYLLER